MRTCRDCNLTSDNLELFVPRKRGKYGRDNWCKDCKNKFFRELNKTEAYVSRRAKSRRSSEERTENNKAIIALAKNNPCADCGGKFPSVAMDFDHIPERGPKLRNISNVGRSSTELLMHELAKCELVCANCHRVRTFKRSQHVVFRKPKVWS